MAKKEIKAQGIRFRVKTRKLLSKLAKKTRQTQDEAAWKAFNLYEEQLNLAPEFNLARSKEIQDKIEKEGLHTMGKQQEIANLSEGA